MDPSRRANTRKHEPMSFFTLLANLETPQAEPRDRLSRYPVVADALVRLALGPVGEAIARSLPRDDHKTLEHELDRSGRPLNSRPD